MADNPHGLDLVRHLYGVPMSGCVQMMYKAGDYSTAMFVGDPVIKTSTSNTAVEALGAEAFPAGSLQEIEVAGAASVVSGVMVGKYITYNNVDTIHSAADTEDIIMVSCDPHIVYRIQEDSASATLAATSCGLNAEIAFDSAGDASTGISGAELDSSSANTTAGHALKIIGLAPTNGNVIGTNADWEVIINDATQMPGTAGI